jgi:hypothetical protein
MKQTENLRVSSFPIPFVCSWFLFIYGGQSNIAGTEVKDLVAYDTVSHTWIKLETNPAPHPNARSVGTACLCGDAVYLFGGSGRFNLVDSTHKLQHPLFSLNSTFLK